MKKNKRTKHENPKEKAARIEARDTAAQIFCWCIVIALNQEEGIGAARLSKACNEMKSLEQSYIAKIRKTGNKKATDAMAELLDGVCELDILLPRTKLPRNFMEEKIRMAENEGARIAWLVMAASARSTFGFGKDRLARLKQESLDNYRQYVEWVDEAGKDYALEQIRRCASAAVGEELLVNDCTSRPSAATIQQKRTIAPNARIAVTSAISAQMAHNSGVKNVPLLVMSEVAARQMMTGVSKMGWKDFK